MFFLLGTNLLKRSTNKINRIVVKFQNIIWLFFVFVIAKLNYFINKNKAIEEHKYLILDVSFEGSLGDEAMIIGSVNLLEKQGIDGDGDVFLSPFHTHNFLSGMITNIVECIIGSHDMSSMRFVRRRPSQPIEDPDKSFSIKRVDPESRLNISD